MSYSHQPLGGSGSGFTNLFNASADRTGHRGSRARQPAGIQCRRRHLTRKVLGDAIAPCVESLEDRTLLSGSLYTTPGQSLRVQAGQTYTGGVATFSSSDNTAQAADFTATISWGDGDTSPAEVTADGNDGNGNLMFSVAAQSGYAYPAVGPETAAVNVSDTVTGDTVEPSVAVASTGLFDVKEISVQFSGAHVNGTFTQSGTPIANGFYQVQADSDPDAVEQSISFTGYSTGSDGTEYQFPNGVNSGAFSISPATPDGLNQTITLVAAGGTGTASAQVHPDITSFTVSDANNASNTVTPPIYNSSDPSTAPTLLAVLDPAAGYATINISGSLGDNDFAHLSAAKWTLTSQDGTISAMSGNLADGPQQVQLAPGASNSFTLKFGFDLNGDGALDSASETQRLVYIKIVRSNSLTVENTAYPSNEKLTVTDDFGEELNVTQTSDENAVIQISDGYQPISSAGGGEVLYEVVDASTGVEIANGTFGGGPALVTLPGGVANDAVYEILAGPNLYGMQLNAESLDAGTNPTTQRADVNVKGFQVVVDPNHSQKAYDGQTNTLTLKSGDQVSLPIKILSNGHLVANRGLVSTFDNAPTGSVPPSVGTNPKTSGTLDGNFILTFSVTSTVTPGTYTLDIRFATDPDMTTLGTITVVVQ